MSGIYTSLIILLVAGLVLFLGLKMSQDKKGKLVFACLVVWSSYMALARQYQLNPLNTVTLRTVVLSPVSRFVERFVFHMPEED
ncbi:MAG: hypothetical protein K0Q90_2877 [Paenibacillaceae bacterium]|jgi:asparagine N-glycosylation enzyme membrane subunit Stt3|nr:hypothetical protein [Paenibacillaceae bacterium]